MKLSYVYIIVSLSKVLYIGVTSDLEKRIYQHKNRLIDGFSKKYKIDRLVYFEAYEDINVAISREKQLKGWRRDKKIALIEKRNEHWKDLAFDWTIG